MLPGLGKVGRSIYVGEWLTTVLKALSAPKDELQAIQVRTSSCSPQPGVQGGQGGDYAIATALPRGKAASLQVRCVTCRIAS